jgi:hypothetical protein
MLELSAKAKRILLNRAYRIIIAIFQTDCVTTVYTLFFVLR